MSEEMSPSIIKAAVSSVWTKYMLMMCLYGKKVVIDAVKESEGDDTENWRKIQAALLMKLEKVNLK